MRAISPLSLEFGISTWSCSALLALRIRVSMSATGSVIIDPASHEDNGCRPTGAGVPGPSPGALCHSGDHSLMGHLAQADPAESELLEHGARPPAAVAARVVAHLVLGRPGGLRDQ